MKVVQNLAKRITLALSLFIGVLLASLLPSASGDARETHSIFSVAQADVPVVTSGSTSTWVDTGSATSATSSSACSSAAGCDADAGNSGVGGNAGDGTSD